MASLAAARYSATRALLAALGARLGQGSGALGQAATAGWRLLSRLDSEHPEAVREVFAYPYVQAWAVHCLQLDGRRHSDTGRADLDRAHLAGIAAAAALRAGVDSELALPLRAGAVFLPGAGAFAVGGADQVARVRVSAAGVSLPGGSGRWRPVRQVREAGLSLSVDDLDPFRDCHAWLAAGRQSTADWMTWRRSLVAAAGQLTAELPAYADVLRTGLRSVVPMRPAAPGLRQSGTARHAFGAVAVARPDRPDQLSELLLHEMQHVKLAVVADLFDLFDRADTGRYRVGWRADPRPVDGLLHGTYAHLAVTELWRSRALTAGPGPAGQEAAAARYQGYRGWVEDAIDTLLGAGSLRPAGERFVEGMRATVKGWTDDW